MMGILQKKGVCMIALLAFTILAAQSLMAQGSFILSKNADFSTDDRNFSRQDTLYMQVTAPDIDFTDIDKNEFELKAGSGGEEFEGHFDNLLNGTFTARISLAGADINQANWEWEGRVGDESGREFRAKVDLQIIDAGTPVGEDVEIRGTIDTLGSDFLTVNGATVFVNASTEVLDRNNAAISFTDLQVGDLVEIRAVRDDQANLLATRIKLEDSPFNNNDDEVELKGPIQSVGTDNVVVLGKTFFVDANTEILDDDKNPISLNDLVVGQLAEVRADVQSDGTLLANRIRLEDPGDNEVEFTGRIDALTDTSISVDGQLFKVTPNTEVLDNDDRAIPFADLATGMIVEIRGGVLAGGMLVATRIKIEDRNDNFGDDEVEITGKVTEITANTITVSGFTFQVDANTMVLDNNNNPIAFFDIQRGFVVEVRADVLTDGTLLATKIKIEDDFNDEIELTGIIEDMGSDYIQVNGFRFFVTDSTVLLDNDNLPIAFTALQVGLIVEVRADVAPDGSLLATRIKIEDRGNDEVELTGTIDSIGNDSLVVAGITFFVDANTVVLNNQNLPIAFAQLQVGFLVEIRGDVRTDGRILATKIKIEDRIADEVEITGKIEGLSENSITVLGRTFGVTENTVVFDNNQNLISFGDLVIGLLVQVRGDLQPDGSLIAIRIKVEDANLDEVEVVGPVDSVGASSVFVVGIEFQVDGNTVIVDNGNNPITFADLMAGQTVEVRANVLAGGVNLATRIKIEDVTMLAGKLSDVVFNGIEVLGKQILVDPSTLILGKLNVVLSIDDLSSGTFVQVRMQQGAGGLYFATKVRVQELNLVTGVNIGTPDDPAQPDDFALLKNYPNPFNPETTISFRIPASINGLVPTQVTVYNLLGQKVRTLVNRPMNPGTYQVRWNGRDDRGVPLASGVYLYRLEAGDFTQTQRMLLLK